MKIKSIKCPSCNANISIKDNATKGVCEYCQSEFIIDDNTVTIEHTGTIEITDDTSLKVANTTLNQFKDYDKSLLLYKSLKYKYAHKKDIYIGLIRSITRDFSINNITIFQLVEINNYWSKYITLATDKDIAKYEEKINELNKNFWYNSLIKKTNNFNVLTTKEPINLIEEAYNNYSKYCDKKEKTILDYKYKQYIKDYKKLIEEKKEKKRHITKIIILSIILVLLAIVIFLLTEAPRKNVKEIKLSEINEHYYNIKSDYKYFEKYLKNTVSEMEVTDVTLNKEKKTVDITVSLKNIISQKRKIVTFDITDDMGPIITPTNCKFTDTETTDVYSCFTLYDFTDGEIDSKKAIVNTEGINFKTAGTKTIKVSATDKDGNENKLNVNVIITKTPIELTLNINENLNVGDTYNLSYSITPNIVSDTSISYTYNKNLVAINNGKLTALKKGKTEICAVSNYNNSIKQCKNINLILQCKDIYTFSFDRSKAETITADENFCTGTYQIYADVLNTDTMYSIKIKPKDALTGDFLTVYKKSSFFNEEGNKYMFGQGSTITTEMGITKIKLVKVK